MLSDEEFKNFTEFCRVLLLGHLVDLSKQAWLVYVDTKNRDFVFRCLCGNHTIKSLDYDLKKIAKATLYDTLRIEAARVIRLLKKDIGDNYE